MRAPARLIAAALLAMYVLFLAAVLMEPHPIVAAEVVSRVGLLLQSHGAPPTMATPSRVEFLLNAAMFAPAVFLAALVFPRHHWANWVVYGFVASGAVELVQGLFLPARTAQFVDVVANTLGALVGAVVALPFVALLARRAPRGSEDGVDGPRTDPALARSGRAEP